METNESNQRPTGRALMEWPLVVGDWTSQRDWRTSTSRSSPILRTDAYRPERAATQMLFHVFVKGWVRLGRGTSRQISARSARQNGSLNPSRVKCSSKAMASCIPRRRFFQPLPLRELRGLSVAGVEVPSGFRRVCPVRKRAQTRQNVNLVPRNTFREWAPIMHN